MDLQNSPILGSQILGTALREPLSGTTGTVNRNHPSLQVKCCSPVPGTGGNHRPGTTGTVSPLMGEPFPVRGFER